MGGKEETSVECGEFELACGLKSTAENHFRAFFGECDTDFTQITNRANSSFAENEGDVVYIVMRAGGMRFKISVRKEIV